VGLITRWILGLTVSVGLGALVTEYFLSRLRSRTRTKSYGVVGVPAGLTGVIERAFFTVVVAFDISGTATAMMAWIGVKMAANWNATEQRDPAGAFTAVLAGLISMLFALVGGLICRAPQPGSP
jgi:hypothetical protein